MKSYAGLLVLSTTSCQVCPGVPKTCPATWSDRCAYICNNGVNEFCAPDDVTTNQQEKITCKACPGKPTTTAAPAPSVISGIPQPATSSAVGDVFISCATGPNPDCPFVCANTGLPRIDKCLKEWTVGAGICAVCPGVASTCPAVSTPSCAFLCTATFQEASFCNAVDITGDPKANGSPKCTPCRYGAGGGNSTAVVPPPAGNTTTALPPPIYTSGASLVHMSSAALIGLFCAMFAF
ncbi:hypothetical protein ABW20_dc0105975 [Dactylellina cionopaga]|nr:hypothetical protein ABW20_dc0105975 [Dactylellina cionopaga]